MNEDNTKKLNHGEDCEACPLITDRREFLRTSAIALAALSFAMPIRSAKATVLQTALGGRKNLLSYPVPAGDGVDVDHDNDVILVRYQGSVYAFALSCPHQNTALKWLEADGRFQCPKHHSKYRPDGTFIEGRATRGMDRYAIRKDGAGVAVDLGVLHEEDKDAEGWAAAVVKVG